MSKETRKRIKELADRLSRIIQAEEWDEDLNPSQWTALTYLARANRFSRSPSQVSNFMGATRGTVSQTLKALARKGLIEETPSGGDKRSIAYGVTGDGEILLKRRSGLEAAVSKMDEKEAEALMGGLETLVRTALKQRGQRPFGVCASCIHHQKKARGGFCKLLQEPLTAAETRQICHEHAETV
jgi:DNA-binding MarR family transcriptional regulator